MTEDHFELLVKAMREKTYFSIVIGKTKYRLRCKIQFIGLKVIRLQTESGRCAVATIENVIESLMEERKDGQ